MILPYLKLKLANEDEEFAIHRVTIGPTKHKDLSLGSVKKLLTANNVKFNKPVKYTESSYRGY